MGSTWLGASDRTFYPGAFSYHIFNGFLLSWTLNVRCKRLLDKEFKNLYEELRRNDRTKRAQLNKFCTKIMLLCTPVSADSS